MSTCKDNFTTTFESYPEMIHFHETLARESTWRRCKVKELLIEPLDMDSSLLGNPGAFVSGTSEEAILDTAQNLGLAIRVGADLYPMPRSRDRVSAHNGVLWGRPA